MCINSDVFIMNRRIGNDKNVGKNTSHDKTLIDYAIGSAEMLCKCQNLEVNDFNPLFSDVQNASQCTRIKRRFAGWQLMTLCETRFVKI